MDSDEIQCTGLENVRPSTQIPEESAFDRVPSLENFTLTHAGDIVHDVPNSDKSTDLIPWARPADNHGEFPIGNQMPLNMNFKQIIRFRNEEIRTEMEPAASDRSLSDDERRATSMEKSIALLSYTVYVQAESVTLAKDLIKRRRIQILKNVVRDKLQDMLTTIRDQVTPRHRNGESLKQQSFTSYVSCTFDTFIDMIKDIKYQGA